MDFIKETKSGLVVVTSEQEIKEDYEKTVQEMQERKVEVTPRIKPTFGYL